MAHIPDLHIESVRKVYDDGDHNAFTDLCWFGERLYLTFRSCPDGHSVFASSRIIVLSSDSGDRCQVSGRRSQRARILM